MKACDHYKNDDELVGAVGSDSCIVTNCFQGRCELAVYSLHTPFYVLYNGDL